MGPTSGMPTGPSISLSKVPSVNELQELLGLQRASLKDTKIFSEATLAWRKSYLTSDGQPASQLLLWKSPSVQTDLRLAAEKFLEDQNNGQNNGYNFWSPTRTWAQDSDLKYPDDRDKIVNLLMQLFWKQNKYLHNNSKHGPKPMGSRDGSTDKLTPARETSHPQKGVSSSSGSTPKSGNRKELSTPTRPVKSAFATESSTKHSDSRPPITTNGSGSVDVLDILDDSDDANTSTRTFVTLSGRISKNPRNEQLGVQNGPRKRLKPNRKKKPHIVSSRKTGRSTQPRNIPLISRPEEVDEVLSGHQAEAVVSPRPVSSGLGTQKSDSTIGAESLVNASVSDGSRHASTHQTSFPSTSFAAPTAPMISAEKPSVPKPGQQSQSTRTGMNIKFKLPTSDFSQFKSKAQPLNPSSKNTSVTTHAKSPESESGVRTTSPNRNSMISQAATEQTSTATYMSQERETPPRWTLRTSPPANGVPTPSTRQGLSSDSTSELGHETNFTQDEASHRFEESTIFSTEKHLKDTTTWFSTEANNTTSTSTNLATCALEPETSATEQRDKSSTIENMTTPTPQPLPQLPVVQTISTSEPPPSAPSLSSQQPTPEPSITSNAPSESPVPRPRPKISIPLWIITREPRYTEENWGNGKFQGPPLSEFIEGITAVTGQTHIEKIKLTLRTPFSDTKFTVFSDAEDAWVAAKAAFAEKLKESRADARMKGLDDSYGYKILIEPFYQQRVLFSDGAEAEEDVFDY